MITLHHAPQSRTLYFTEPPAKYRAAEAAVLEAVSAGMDMAFAYSARQGLCRAEDAARVSKHLTASNMPRIDSVKHLIDPGRLLKHMGQDKKNESGQLTLILPREIGETYVEKQADRASVHTYFQSLLTKSAT